MYDMEEKSETQYAAIISDLTAQMDSYRYTWGILHT